MADHPRNGKIHAISFTPETEAIIEAKAVQLMRLGEAKPNRSLAVRAIVLEWAKLTGLEVPEPAPPTTPKKSRKKS